MFNVCLIEQANAILSMSQLTSILTHGKMTATMTKSRLVQISHTHQHQTAHHRHPDTARRITIKPEPYHGREDWEEYLSHFEVCAELGRWSENDMVLALAASLRGPARTFYISLSAAEKCSYAALIDKLGQRFGSSRQQNRWLSRLRPENAYQMKQ